MRHSLTARAHARLKEQLKAGDIAVDATAGNGHDTLFLARTVGPQGRVYAFDIQAEALAATRRRLAGEPDLAPVALVSAGHETISNQLPVERHGAVAAVMFNLGYLPGGDKGLTTHTDSTLAALTQAAALLRPGGLISVIAYTGHPGGRAEADAVRTWSETLPTTFRVTHERPPEGSDGAPEWFLIEKIT